MTGSPTYPGLASEASGRASGTTVHVLLNPASAGGRAMDRWRRLERGMDRAIRAGLELFVSPSAEALIERARQLAATDCVVVAAGGDGTSHAVVNGLLADPPDRLRALLAWLPLGSGNDLARSVGVPRSPRAALELLTTGQPRRIDAGTIRYQDAAGQARQCVFANSLTLGLSSRALEILAARPWLRRGPGTYAAAALVAVLEGRTASAIVASDSGRLGPFLLVAFANSGRFGAGLTIAPAARLDDGWLDLVTVAPMSRLRALAAFPRLLVGRHLSLREVRHELVRQRTLTADVPLMLEVDGERLVAPPPISVELLPGVLRVLGPTAADGGVR